MASVLGGCGGVGHCHSHLQTPRDSPCVPTPPIRGRARKHGSVPEMSHRSLCGSVPGTASHPRLEWLRETRDPFVSGLTKTYMEDVAMGLCPGEGRGCVPWLRKRLTSKGFTQKRAVRKTMEEEKRWISGNENPADHRHTHTSSPSAFPLAIFHS